MWLCFLKLLLCFDAFAQIWSGHPGGICLWRNARSKADAAPNHGRLGIGSENTILIVMAISFIYNICIYKEVVSVVSPSLSFTSDDKTGRAFGLEKPAV